MGTKGARKGVRSICTVKGCDKIVVSHGYCSAHWYRLKRHGTLEVTVLRGPTDTTADRYWQKVDRRGPDDCWPWLAALTASGHASFMFPLPDGKRGRLAHRYGWTLHHGDIPGGKHIDHTCHDPRVCDLGVACPHRSCQNPAHMGLVNPTENTAVDRRRTRADLTHCKRGHEFTPENTYLYVRNGREERACRQCARDRHAAKTATAE
jgi:hypothetical protein